jgi:hypothetical protein
VKRCREHVRQPADITLREAALKTVKYCGHPIDLRLREVSTEQSTDRVEKSLPINGHGILTI